MSATGKMTSDRMQGKVVMVTGANGDMGREIVAELARQGARVVAVVRSPEQVEALRREIAVDTGHLETDVLVADLADQAQIRRLVSEFRRRHARLDALVNNAGIHLQGRHLGPDGTEMHLAVNFLAPVLLTLLLLDTLKASAPSRIVNVSSQSMADTRSIPFLGRPRPATLELDNMQSERHFDAVDAYARSKLALVMFGYALARRLAGSGVTVNALHPGIVATSIVDDLTPRIARPALGLIKRLLLTPEEGAKMAIDLASDPAVAHETGKYFIKGRMARSPTTTYDIDLQEQLWQASLMLVGLSTESAADLD